MARRDPDVTAELSRHAHASAPQVLAPSARAKREDRVFSAFEQTTSEAPNLHSAAASPAVRTAQLYLERSKESPV
jgi:hypothetical protein